MKYYTIKETSDILKRNERTIWNYLHNGILRGKKIGAMWLISETEIKRAAEGT